MQSFPQDKVAEKDNAVGMVENKKAAKKGGVMAKEARVVLEKGTGKKVISKDNFLHKNRITEIKEKTRKYGIRRFCVR